MQTNKIDILYLASNGFAVRMVIQTNLLGKLVESGLRVGIVSYDKEDPTLKSYCKANGVALFAFNPTKNFYTGSYQIVRRYALEDIRHNPALWEKHLRNVQDTVSRGRRLKYKAYFALYQTFTLLPFLRKLFLAYERRSIQSAEADAFIAQADPSLVVSTYPVNIMESMLLKAAKPEDGRKRVIHLLSWDNITCKGRFFQLADRYIAWGELMKVEFVKYYGVKPKQISITGVPHFDLHHQCKDQVEIDTLLRKIGLNPDLPYLFFGMSAPYFAPGEMDVVERIAAWINNEVFGPIQFVVRPHPQNMQGNMADFSWLPRLQAIESERIYVDYPRLNDSAISWSMKMDDMKQLSLLIGGSSIVLNSCSTISIDALVHNKPVLLTIFDGDQDLPWFKSVRRVAEYEHIKHIIRLGGAVKVENFDELASDIQKFLDHADWNLEARQRTIYAECGIQDGKATGRVIETIKHYLE